MVSISGKGSRGGYGNRGGGVKHTHYEYGAVSRVLLVVLARFTQEHKPLYYIYVT